MSKRHACNVGEGAAIEGNRDPPDEGDEGWIILESVTDLVELDLVIGRIVGS
jgi:hypothetical protein